MQSNPNQSAIANVARMLGNRLLFAVVPIAVILAAVIAYYAQVFLYNVNAPVSDDYGIALLFMNNYVDQVSLADKIRILFSQHGEHRLMVPHLIVLIDYFVEGHVNFYTLGIIGNLGLAALLIVFYKSMPSYEHKLFYFCPLVPLVLQIQHWEITAFPTASIQGFHVVFLALLTLLFLDRNSRLDTALAFFLFFMTIYSSGSGMMVFVPGALVLLVRKRYKILGWWAAFFVLNMVIYFVGYTNDLAPNFFELITRDTPGLMLRYLAAAGGFINYAKGWEEAGWGYPAAITSGALITAFFLFLTIKKYYLKAPVWYGFFIFLLLCCATLAFSRFALYTPVQMSAVSRYKIISVALVGLCYLAALDLFRPSIRPYWAIAGILFSGWYCKVAYERDLDILRLHTDGSVETSFAIFQYGDYGQIRDWNPALSAGTLKESEIRDVYRIPDLREEYIKRTPLSPGGVYDVVLADVKPADSTVQYKFDLLESSGKTLYAIRKGWALRKGASTKRNVLVFQSANKTYFFQTHMHWRLDVTSKMHAEDPADNNNYDGCGFNVAIKADQLEKGEYQVGIVLQSWDGTSYYIPANRKVVI